MGVGEAEGSGGGVEPKNETRIYEKNISDYYETVRRLNTLKKHTYNKVNVEQYTPILKLLLKYLPLTVTTLNNHYLYRSRWNQKNELFTHVDQLTYPKAEFIKRKGRLNDVNESILYSALCELGTLIESRPQLHKPITISKIEQKQQGSIAFMTLGILDREFSHRAENKTQKLIIDYLHSEMIKTVSTDDYNSTIALAHHFLKTPIKQIEVLSPNLSRYAGLAYPSVQGKMISNVTTYNIAMLPEVFDENYFFKETTLYALTNEETHYQLNPLSEGNIDEQGNVHWQHTFNEIKERARDEYKFELIQDE